ncbi:MAG: glycosyltransferase family 9 protein [Porticoccaceae bacterium]
MRWSNLLRPKKVVTALRIESHASAQIIRHGYPDICLQFLGGLGDELMLTCLARELKKRDPSLRIWQISAAAELLRGNPDYHLVLGPDYWPLRHSNLLARNRTQLSYSRQLNGDDRWEIPQEHVLLKLLRQAGIKGDVVLRPYVHLNAEERRTFESDRVQICVQSLGQGTHETWMLNKIWPHERLCEVIENMHQRHPSLKFVQLGLGVDPKLPCDLDLRGRTSLRETASALAASQLFLGGEGFLAHLARAVDTRSVVIFGGRSRASQLGYGCNINLETYPACSPCWSRHRCDWQRTCLDQIAVSEVIDALERALAEMDQPLAVDFATVA